MPNLMSDINAACSVTGVLACLPAPASRCLVRPKIPCCQQIIQREHADRGPLPHQQASRPPLIHFTCHGCPSRFLIMCVYGVWRSCVAEGGSDARLHLDMRPSPPIPPPLTCSLLLTLPHCSRPHRRIASTREQAPSPPLAVAESPRFWIGLRPGGGGQQRLRRPLCRRHRFVKIWYLPLYAIRPIRVVRAPPRS